MKTCSFKRSRWTVGPLGMAASAAMLLLLPSASRAAPCSYASYGDSTWKIQMQECGLTGVLPPVPARFTKLTHFYVHTNQITNFPDMRAVAAQLTYVHLGKNEMPDPAPELIAPLVSLQRARWYTNQFTEFPDLTPSGSTLFELWLTGNRITDPPAARSKPLTALQYAFLGVNRLTKIPDLTGSKSTLKILQLHDNPIHNIDTKLLSPLVNLEELILENVPLTTFPHMPGLIKLKKLNLIGTSFKQLPPLWPLVPSGLTLQMTSTPLDLCNCRNLWLKQATPTYGNFQYDDVTCSATLWSAHTLDSLNATCQQNFYKAGVLMMTALRDTHMSPVTSKTLPTTLRHPYHAAASHVQCLALCSQLSSCSGFWMNESAVAGGSGCVLIAPSLTGGSTIEVPDAGWTYYGASDQHVQ